MLGSQIDAKAEEARVNARVEVLMRISAEANVDFWSDERRCRAIVQFEDRATQARELINFCRSSLAMAYNAMFPRNPQPETFAALMELFKDTKNIHRFIKA